MDTITSRRDARDSLTALLTTISGFQAVYDHLPKSIDGQSPVCSIESMSQFPRFEGSAVEEAFQFVVGVWVLRASGSANVDAGAAEDTLDALAQSVAQAVQGWANAVFYQPSQTDYADMENGQYRVEWHFVAVDWQ